MLMAARTPEELDRLFAGAMNAGNLDALVALYEPQASLTPAPGKVAVGIDAIREALAGFLAGNPKMTLTPRVVSRAGDLALLTSKWEIKMTDADGKPAELHGQSVEVARRQPDGNWLFAIDLPLGIDTPQS
jgi:uncharacterized protein (TIGR02246 family)